MLAVKRKLFTPLNLAIIAIVVLALVRAFASGFDHSNSVSAAESRESSFVPGSHLDHYKVMESGKMVEVGFLNEGDDTFPGQPFSVYLDHKNMRVDGSQAITKVMYTFVNPQPINNNTRSFTFLITMVGFDCQKHKVIDTAISWADAGGNKIDEIDGIPGAEWVSPRGGEKLAYDAICN